METYQHACIFDVAIGAVQEVELRGDILGLAWKGTNPEAVETSPGTQLVFLSENTGTFSGDELNFVDASGDAVRPDVRIRDAVSKSGDFVAAGGMAWNLSNTKLAFTGRLEYDSITDNCCALRIFDADACAVKHLIRFKEPHDADLEAGRALEPDVVQVEWNEM